MQLRSAAQRSRAVKLQTRSTHLLLALLRQASAAPGGRWLRGDGPLRLLAGRHILAAAGAACTTAGGPPATLADQVHGRIIAVVLLPAAQWGRVAGGKAQVLPERQKSSGTAGGKAWQHWQPPNGYYLRPLGPHFVTTHIGGKRALTFGWAG